MASHRITTETSFVAGDREVNTGNCGEFHDWQEGSQNEAKRIADGLGGVVVEETPLGEQTWEWTDHKGVKQTSRSTNLLRLAVQVNGVVVARVHAGTVGIPQPA